MPIVPAIIACVLATAQPDVSQLAALDRAAQALAMEAIVATCDGCEANLAALWSESERADVRLRVAETLGRLGAAGTLIDLTHDDSMRRFPESAEFLIDGLVVCGPGVIDTIVARIEADAEPSGASLLPLLAEAHGLEAAAIARSLLESEDERVRMEAMFYVVSYLPADERYAIAMGGLSDPSESVQAHARRGLTSRWPVLTRLDAADAYASYQAEIISWLDSDDPDIVDAGLDALRTNAPVPTEAEPALARLMADQDREHAWWDAMRAYMDIRRTPGAERAAVERIAQWLEDEPQMVGDLLERVDPESISDDLVRRIVALVRDEWDGRDAAWRLLTSTDRPHLGPLGSRALPMLIEAMGESEGDVARAYALMLRSFGPQGHAAAERWVAKLDEAERRTWPAWPEEPEAKPARGAVTPEMIDAARTGEAEAATALAGALLGHPEEVEPTLAALADDPDGLAAVLSVWVRVDGEEFLLELPEDADPALVAAALDALLGALPRVVDDPESNRAGIIGALGSLPTTDPSRADTLAHLARFGGAASSHVALMSLARVRPADPRAVELGRVWFAHRGHHTRLGMELATMMAIGVSELGEAGRPLIDELLRLGERAMEPAFFDLGYARWINAVLHAIDPADPRVIVFAAELDAAHARVREWAERPRG